MPASRRLSAIMFTDTVGYSTAAHADEAGTIARLHEQERLVRPVLREFHGREIKSTGDGFLVEFDSALRAVQCAIEIQQRMHDRNDRPGAVRTELRIGIHLGDVERSAHDILGDAVNIASRVEPLASAGGICVSQQVFDQVSHRVTLPFEGLGARKLKGIEEPVRIYRILLPWEPRGPPGTGLEPPTERYRLAVLPLANISPDPRDEYFADGLTEELIATLSRLRPLRVIARTSVNQYKSTAKSVPQIGAELDVGSVIEGSVRKSGNRLRITLQLIDVTTQEHVWAESFDRELDDVFAVQAEIAEKTGRALRLEFGRGSADRTKRPTQNLAAYNLYLRGVHAARLSTLEGYRESMHFFEEAIRGDPDFARARAALANMYLLLAGDDLPPKEAYPRARELIAGALELDPESPTAHAARGNLLLQSVQDWAGAEREFRRALELNPSDVDARFWYAALLRAVERYPEAIDEARTVLELDPLWSLQKEWLTITHFLARDLDGALALADEAIEEEPAQSAPHLIRGWIYLRRGRADDARREAERATTARRMGDRLARADLWARLGELSDARQQLSELTTRARSAYVAPSALAALHAVLGERDRAYEWLDRDLREGDRTLWSEYQFPYFDSLREEPRFHAILGELHLPSRT